METKLGEEAIEEIKSFYVEIRNKDKDIEPLISIRDLIIIREYAKKLAKERGNNLATKEDAIKSIEKIKKKVKIN